MNGYMVVGFKTSAFYLSNVFYCSSIAFLCAKYFLLNYCNLLFSLYFKFLFS